MGGVRKPLLKLGGEPVLLHALRPFLDHPRVGAIAVALGEEEWRDPPEWLSRVGPRVVLVVGGASRTESVWSALQALPASLALLAIHDAARPMVTTEIIDRCILEAQKGHGAVAGWPAVDTLKKVGEGSVISGTLTRKEIWHAQTPQVFPREMIMTAYADAIESGVFDTDDAALVERLGGEVVMVRGSSSNLKVTRPEDLSLAELLLSGEGR